MIIFIFYKHTCQTEISRSAKKKKSSKSGGAKNAIGDLCREQFETSLCFFGAGGHVEISGIRNLCAFGVQQPLEGISTTPSKSMSPIFEKSPELVVLEEQLEEGKFLDIIASWCLIFLECAASLFFLKLFLLGCFLLGLVLLLILPDGAISNWSTNYQSVLNLAGVAS